MSDITGDGAPSMMGTFRSGETPPILADLMALKIDGPTIVFLRPRVPLRMQEAEAMKRILDRLPQKVDDKSVAFVLIAAEFDIMAVGDAELKQYGLTRLPGA